MVAKRIITSQQILEEDAKQKALLGEHLPEEVIAPDNLYQAIVRKSDGKENFLSPDGNLLSNIWFEEVRDFKNGVALVKTDRGHLNFLSRKGRLLSKTNFIGTSGFVNDFAAVQLDFNCWNYLKMDGDFLLPEPVYYAYPFSEGFGRVAKTPHKYSFVDREGNYIVDDVYDDAEDFCNGFAVVTLRDIQQKKNFLCPDGTYLREYWYADVSHFTKRWGAYVEGNSIYHEPCNLLKPDGTFWFKESLGYIEKLDDEREFLLVKSSHFKSSNIIKPDGTFLSDEWFASAKMLSNGFCVVKTKNGEWNLVKPNGTFVWKKHRTDTVLDDIHDFDQILRMPEESAS